MMMRLPKRLLDRADIDPFLGKIEWVKVWNSGSNLIIDIQRDEVGPDEDWDDGSGRLAALAPLRAAALSGDFRLFYLLWLTAVEEELVTDDQVEPLPGIGPLSGALEAFADFFGIDPDLVQAAAERGADIATTIEDDLIEMLSVISKSEKIGLLVRALKGDRRVDAELKSSLRRKRSASAPGRTVAALRTRAREIAEVRESAAVERREAKRRREAEEAEKARRARLKALKQRGEGVWSEIESKIERRNRSGYDRAATLLHDLQALAIEEGSQADFYRRLAAIQLRHEKKGKLIERLRSLGRDHGGHR